MTAFITRFKPTTSYKTRKTSGLTFVNLACVFSGVSFDIETGGEQIVIGEGTTGQIVTPYSVRIKP